LVVDLPPLAPSLTAGYAAVVIEAKGVPVSGVLGVNMDRYLFYLQMGFHPVAVVLQ
jgi:hypothetical protein